MKQELIIRKLHLMFPTFALVALMLVVLIACEQRQTPLKLQVGQLLKQVAVTDLKGVGTTLSLATGKVTILNIWATWCGPCRHEMPSLDRLANLLDSEKIEVVGLSVDSDDYVVREFLIERKVGFVNYMDPAMEISNNVLGVRAYPSTFIFSAEGKLLDVIEGWKEWDTVEMIENMNRFTR